MNFFLIHENPSRDELYDHYKFVRETALLGKSLYGFIYEFSDDECYVSIRETMILPGPPYTREIRMGYTVSNKNGEYKITYWRSELKNLSHLISKMTYSTWVSEIENKVERKLKEANKSEFKKKLLKL